MPIVVTKKLPMLPTSPRMGVFRALEALWKADPVLRSAVRQWKTYAGDPADRNPLSNTMDCAVRLWPVGGAEKFWAPGSMTSWLTIEAEMFVRSFVLEDLDGLYWQFGRGFYGGTQAAGQAIIQRLKAAGAHTGLLEMSGPPVAPPDQLGDAGGLHGVGQFRIEIRNDFQPNPNIQN